MELNNFDKLVHMVTKNVLEKLNYKTSYKINDKSLLVILPSLSFGMKRYFDYIQDIYPGYDLYIASNEKASKISFVEQNTNIHFIKFDLEDNEFIPILDAVQTIIVLGLKINQMKALTKADDKEDLNHLILGSIMANKPVTILVNTNETMFHKISEIVHDVRKLGIEVTNIQEIKTSTLHKVDLITESYVMNLKNRGLKILTLNKKQLITPLAKDKLSELKIKIQYIEEEQ